MRSRWAAGLLIFFSGTVLAGPMTAPIFLPRQSRPAAPLLLPRAPAQPRAAAVKRQPKTCSQLIEALERSVLDLNARSWSSVRSLPGFSADEVSAAPEESILTVKLREGFRSRLAYWDARPAAPLSAQESAKLKKVEKKIASLSDCRSLSDP